MEVSKDLNESVVLNKSLYIRSCDFKSVDWYGVGYCIWIKNNAVNSIIDSFIFHSINQEYGAVVLQNATNCLVANSNFNVVGYSAVYSFLVVVCLIVWLIIHFYIGIILLNIQLVWTVVVIVIF